MKLFLTCVITLVASPAFAQAPASTESPAAQRRRVIDVEDQRGTPTGHQVSAGFDNYTYREPGDQAISISGTKIAAAYTGTRALDRNHHWFLQTQVNGAFGNTSYVGWCSPFLIVPDGSSPNGYALDLGDAEPCTENGDADWYIEGRVLAGKDFIGRHWTLTPHTGLGLRHLSNGLAGAAGYRTDDYLYLPVGMTVRTGGVARRSLSVTVEYDRLLHGWQKTRDSDLGSGGVPATPDAPAFTIDGFTDVSFSQSLGWALRLNATYQVTRHWSLEPYFVHWRVEDSTPNSETVAFTVNGVSAREQFFAFEPFNVTNEFGLRIGVRF